MKKTVNAFVHYEQSYTGETVLSVYPFSMASTGKVLVGEQSIEVEIPDDFDPVAEEVRLLKKARQKLLDQTNQRVLKIDDEIAKRLSIGYEPGPSVDLSMALSDGIPF